MRFSRCPVWGTIILGFLDDRKQPVINKRLAEGIVLDVGEGDRIVGIEILDASKRLNLEGLLPVKYGFSVKTA